MRIAALENLRNVVSTQTGQPKIKQDHAESSVESHLQALCSIERPGNVMGVLGETLVEQSRHAYFVLDHKDTHLERFSGINFAKPHSDSEVFALLECHVKSATRISGEIHRTLNSL